MKPLFIINFKTYEEATSENAVKLAKECEKVSSQRIRIIVALQTADIYRVRSSVDIQVYAQHVDNIDFGKNTGFILPQNVKEAGASGTLLNHAEHKLDYKVLESTIKICKKLKLSTVVCAANNKEAGIIATYEPDYIAVEPPELIGTGVSVSSAKPEVISSSIKAVLAVKNIPVLCGAGISTGRDVSAAIKLGVAGVLLASAVTTSNNPGKVLKDLVKVI